MERTIDMNTEIINKTEELEKKYGKDMSELLEDYEYKNSNYDYPISPYDLYSAWSEGETSERQDEVLMDILKDIPLYIKED